MGRKAKGQRSLEKKNAKKAQKAQDRAAMTAKIGHTKSRRAVKKARSILTPSVKHAVANCGNPGCERCHSLLVGNTTTVAVSVSQLQAAS